MIHLSLPNDISEEQMLDLIPIIEKSAGLSENQAITLELDGVALVAEIGGASRIEYCRTLARLVNSGLVMIAVIFALASCKPTPKPTPDDLPSVSAIQQRLNEIEPRDPVKVDGKLGPATQAKWDHLFIEQSARNAWRDFEKGT